MRKLTARHPNGDRNQRPHGYEIDDKGEIIKDLGPATSLLVLQEIHEKVRKYQEEKNIHQIQATAEIVEAGLAVLNLCDQIKR